MLEPSLTHSEKFAYTHNNATILGGLIRYVCTCNSVKLLNRKHKDYPQKFSGGAGHCVYASEALYHIMDNDRLTQMRAPCEFFGYHWYVQDDEGVILDPSSDQYYTMGIIPPYEKGTKTRPYSRDKQWNFRVLNKSLFVIEQVRLLVLNQNNTVFK